MWPFHDLPPVCPFWPLTLDTTKSFSSDDIRSNGFFLSLGPFSVCFWTWVYICVSSCHLFVFWALCSWAVDHLTWWRVKWMVGGHSLCSLSRSCLQQGILSEPDSSSTFPQATIFLSKPIKEHLLEWGCGEMVPSARITGFFEIHLNILNGKCCFTYFWLSFFFFFQRISNNDLKSFFFFGRQEGLFCFFTIQARQVETLMWQCSIYEPFIQVIIGIISVCISRLGSAAVDESRFQDLSAVCFYSGTSLMWCLPGLVALLPFLCCSSQPTLSHSDF